MAEVFPNVSLFVGQSLCKVILPGLKVATYIEKKTHLRLLALGSSPLTVALGPERWMWLSVPSHPCLGSPALEFSSAGNGSPAPGGDAGEEQREHPLPLESVRKILSWQEEFIYSPAKESEFLEVICGCFTETLRTYMLSLVMSLQNFVIQLRVPTSQFSSTHSCLAVFSSEH